MNDDKKALHESLRAIVLRKQAADDPIGIYRYAKLSAGTREEDRLFSKRILRLAARIAAASFP